jgi:hypothetical protein
MVDFTNYEEYLKVQDPEQALGRVFDIIKENKLENEFRHMEWFQSKRFLGFDPEEREAAYMYGHVYSELFKKPVGIIMTDNVIVLGCMEEVPLKAVSDDFKSFLNSYRKSELCLI